jgi:hypothetical protein
MELKVLQVKTELLVLMDKTALKALQVKMEHLELMV